MDSRAPVKSGPLFLLLAAFTAAVGLYLVFVLFRYGSQSGYFDYIEASIAIASWQLLEGRPLYQEIGEWPFFNNAYGPMVYLFEAAVFAVAGVSVQLGKLAGELALAGAVIVFFLHARRNYGFPQALFGILLFVAFILFFAPYSIWNRPDPFIIFMVSLAVYANGRQGEHSGSRSGGWPAQAAIGVCIGLAVNLKVHSFMYFLPLMLDSCGWKGLRGVVIIAVVSITVFLLPFTLAPISLVNYVTLLHQLVSDKAVDPAILSYSLRISVLFLSPGFLLAGLLALRGKRIQAKDGTYFAALAVCVAALLFPASVPGQGPYHLLPIFPITVDVILRLSRGFSDMPRTKVGILAVLSAILLTISVPAQRRLMRNLDRLATETVAEEITAIAGRHPGETVGMGYGGTFEKYRYTFYKPVLVFAGNPPTVDSQAIMEFQTDGVDFIGRFIAELKSCRIRHWLVPKDEPPFRMHNFYGARNLFGVAPEVFEDTYEKSETHKYFDVWSCKSAAPVPSGGLN